LQRSIRKPADRERLCRSWQFARWRACPAGWSDCARHRRPDNSSFNVAGRLPVGGPGHRGCRSGWDL